MKDKLYYFDGSLRKCQDAFAGTEQINQNAIRKMTYRQAIDFLYNQLPAYHRIGKAAYKNNLDNTLVLDAHFGHPHKNFISIHVAGTNGKGSVSHMLASILREAGYRTGLYTSPHLKDFRERIRIDGAMIPESEVAGFVTGNMKIIESLKPSFFELTVAMAFEYFSRQRVDVAVIETGLGGRLDSTNIIKPVISVITNIGHDHMDLLGDTLEKVAAEKAGIIKEGVPVVIGETQVETRAVFTGKAREENAEIVFADRNYKCSLGEFLPDTGGRIYQVTGKKNRKSFRGFTVLGGDYQAKNLVTVIQVALIARKRFDIKETDIIRGIENVITNTGLAGRWQIIGRAPLTICDTGHNKEGLLYVTSQIKKTRKAGLHMIIGFVNDKDLSAVLPLLPSDATYYFTKASVTRALDENILKEKALAYGLSGSAFPDVRSAMEAAFLKASKDDLVFIGGSTFIVADAL